MRRVLIMLILILIFSACYAELIINDSLQTAADKGDPKAMYELGMLYYDAVDNYEITEHLYLPWFQAAHLKGFAPATLMLGKCYIIGMTVDEDVEEGIRLVREAIAAGSAEAEVYLAYCHEWEIGLSANDAEVFRLYSSAMNKGYLPAKVEVGKCYRYAKGVEEDLDKAKQLFTEAVVAGEGGGGYELGSMHYNGNGFPVDYDEAYFWTRIGMELGCGEASGLFGFLELLLSNAEMDAANRRAMQWLEQHRKN